MPVFTTQSRSLGSVHGILPGTIIALRWNSSEIAAVEVTSSYRDAESISGTINYDLNYITILITYLRRYLLGSLGARARARVSVALFAPSLNCALIAEGPH